jgi:sorting nexin-8
MMCFTTSLEEKLAQLRGRIGSLVDYWTRICATFERVSRRREAQGADFVRLRLGLDAVVAVERSGWRLAECESVEAHTGLVAERIGKAGEVFENRARALQVQTLERFKSHRDAYAAFSDLFVRHARLAPDAVDKLKKRVETNQKKHEQIRQAKKERWEVEAERVKGAIEADQHAIQGLLRRRVLIRACCL